MNRKHVTTSILALCLLFLALCFDAAAQDSAGSTHSGKAATKSVKKSTAKSAKKTAKNKAPVKSEQAFKDTVGLALDAQMRGQYASAMVYCGQALDVMPDDIDDSIKAGTMMICLQLYDHNNKLDEAAQVASKLKKLPMSPEMSESLCFTEATLLTKMHRWDEAEARYADCPGKTPSGQAAVLGNVAELYMIREDPVASISKYEQAIALQPGYPHTEFGLAVALSRTNQWDAATKHFLAGVSTDPGFRFLEYAFFEPAAENDYQTAYRMLAMHREKEAAFYLDRYVKSEMRQTYRDSAAKVLEKIRARQSRGETAIHDAVPALLENVRNIAIDTTGKRLAFSSVERKGKKEIQTSVWTLDTESGRTTRRIVLPDDIVTAMMFVDDTPTLHVVGGKQRYSLDVSVPDSGYYCYDNHPALFAMGLSGHADDVASLTSDGYLTLSPWLEPTLQVPITRVPNDTRRIQMSNDHNTAIINTTNATHIVDVTSAKIRRELSSDFGIESLAAHPSKDLLAIGMQSGTLLVDKTGKFQALLGSPGTQTVSALSFSPDGRWLAALSENTVEIWDVEKSLASNP